MKSNWTSRSPKAVIGWRALIMQISKADILHATKNCRSYEEDDEMLVIVLLCHGNMQGLKFHSHIFS